MRARAVRLGVLIALALVARVSAQISVPSTLPPQTRAGGTWQGHSIGRWDGDTLVVDTVGFNDLTWFDNYGHLHSNRMHVVERFTRTDLGHLAVVVTVDDPGAYSKPFTLRYTAELMPNTDLMEYICDNEQDAPNIDAPADAAIDAAKLLKEQR